MSHALANAIATALPPRPFFDSATKGVHAKRREEKAREYKTRHNKGNGALAVHHIVTAVTREVRIEVVLSK